MRPALRFSFSVALRPDFPTNKGGLCRKAWTTADLLVHPERPRIPLVHDRKGGDPHPATWDEALDRLVTAVQGA